MVKTAPIGVRKIDRKPRLRREKINASTATTSEMIVKMRRGWGTALIMLDG